MQVKESKLIVMNNNVKCYIDRDLKIPAKITLKETLPYYITQLYNDNDVIISNYYSVISANIIDNSQMHFVSLIPSDFKEFNLLSSNEQECIKSLKHDTTSVNKKRFNNPRNISSSGQQVVDNIDKSAQEYDKNKDTKMRVPRLNDANEYVDEKGNITTPDIEKSNIEYELIDQPTFDNT